MRFFFSLLSIILLLFSCGKEGNTSLNQKIRGEGDRSLILTAGPEEVWVGVPFSLELVMKGEKGDDVLFPEVTQETLPDGLLLKKYRVDDNELTLTVTAEKPGSYSLPPLTVLFDNSRGGIELLTRPVEFEVVSLVEEGEEGFSDIAPAMKIGFLTRNQAFLISFLFLITGFLLFWLLYWRRREKLAPPEPVWIMLEREKDALTAEGHLVDEDRACFYDRAVSLVKKALDGVYGENTGERTREEFIGGLLTSSQYDPEVKAWFVNFFERADLIRFARIDVEKASALRDLDETVHFVTRAAEKARLEEEDRS